MTLLGVLVLVAAIALLLKLFNPLPDISERQDDLGNSNIAGSTLEQIVSPLVSEHLGQSGIHLLPEARGAFVARVMLIRAAERTLDMQYYIWSGDLSGRMLLEEVVKAADRGVKVRLIVDDNTTAGTDWLWATANSHPNIEVRLFNPLTMRSPRFTNYLFDFPRINRRMHNKSLTVDRQVTIVGGRNVGDEYFGVKTEGLFIDLDVLAMGAIVPDVVDDFNRYWNSRSVHNVSSIIPVSTIGELDTLRHYEETAVQNGLKQLYTGALKRSPFFVSLESGSLDLRWSEVTLYSDDPIKGEGKAREEDLLISKLRPRLANARRSIQLISAYLVPAERGTQFLSDIAKSGTDLTLVTNSFVVNDVPVVHAGYAKRRRTLLENGARIYEMRAQRNERENHENNTGWTRFSGNGESLHAKTFILDNAELLVGSFNFDPRSALLNCEMLFVIDHAELATTTARAVNEGLERKSYQVQIVNDQLTWSHRDKDGLVQTAEEPGMTGGQKLLIKILGWLPIDWLL